MQKDKELLQQERNKLQDQIDRLERALEQKPDYGIGEGDPSITRWELNLALLKQYQDRMTRLERALAKSEKGKYGMCERCGEPIHPDRLAVLPGTRLCIRCAQEQN